MFQPFCTSLAFYILVFIGTTSVDVGRAESETLLLMSLVSPIVAYAQYLDARFMHFMSRHWFTYDLVHNPVSRVISETLFVMFVLLLSYETIYWSGIYLNLWEYHAKDIFPEVPVHCAHVYVRLNVAKRDKLQDVKKYYSLERSVLDKVLGKRHTNVERETFELPKFVKYHFEFGPEDFEHNPDPELGSTIEHLRERILELFHESTLYEKFRKAKGSSFTKDDVFLTNNKLQEVGLEYDKTYLSKIHIETGNVIDAVILY